MKETFTNSFAEMTDAELNKLSDAIKAEMLRRHNLKQERMWNAVKNAIKDYIKEFGGIEFEIADGETFYLDENDDYQVWGSIRQIGEW